ncbi:MAG: type 1 glutamine amidotransferase [Candidatus Sulfobium sp.]
MTIGKVLDIIYSVSVLILKNVAGEGPGTIEEFLVGRKVPYRVVEMYREDLPCYSDMRTLVVMGGPMSVNESDIYPYLSREEQLVREFLEEGRRVLGICLGAQVMAKALGAKVYPGPQKEIGWYDIELRGEGIRDPMMGRLGAHPRAEDFRKVFRVFHWHGETFDIPRGAERLARSALYENQAFRYGKGAYAFQFHMEVTKEMIYGWLKDEAVDMEKVRMETEMFYDDYHGRAVNFYEAFFTPEPEGEESSLRHKKTEEVINEKD